MGTPTTTETPEQKQFRQFMNNISQTRSNLDAIETLITKYPGIVSVPYVIKPTFPEPTIFLCNSRETTETVQRCGVNIEYDHHWVYGNMGSVKIEGVNVILIDDLDEVR